MLTDFPAHFKWGTATAAFQIEGAVEDGGRGKSVWDVFTHNANTILNQDTADVACDHYHRFESDLDLMQQLGVNAYRFSLAWPRILPEGRGRINAAGLDFYDRYLDALLKRGIEPMVTLYHWDLPQALEDKGGWRNRDTAFAFAEYANVVAARLSDRVGAWVTLNEPWVFTMFGHLFGSHAPGLQSFGAAFRCAHHALLAHGLGALALRSHGSKPVGIALNMNYAQAATRSSLDVRAANLLDTIVNRLFADPVFGFGYPQDLPYGMRLLLPYNHETDLNTIAQPLDFLGINYYLRQVVRQPSRNAPQDDLNNALRAARLPLELVPASELGNPITSMGWEVYPEAFTAQLLRVTERYKPKSIVVTENGAAFEDVVTRSGKIHDTERGAYLQNHIAAVLEARKKGAPIDGYCVWSFLDNFEWAEGFSKRFGLYHVDYHTQERRLKDSGAWFASALKEWRTHHSLLQDRSQHQSSK